MKKRRLIALLIMTIISITALGILLILVINGSIRTEQPTSDNQNTEELYTEKELEIEENNDKIATPKPSECDNGNFTISWGPLMLVNYYWNVSAEWIANRRTELIDLAATYGVHEWNVYNGTPLMDAEAATHLHDMMVAYSEAYPGHELGTLSCFRAVGTSCGRMCATTGTSDHHSGYTCDLIDGVYGTALDTDYAYTHPEWTWLHDNSYKYGFIDRYIPEWAGGSMNDPLNVNEYGTTGYYETWHFRYVGIDAATEIANGKYNNGAYDSLEHYLKVSRGLSSLTSPAANCTY